MNWRHILQPQVKCPIYDQKRIILVPDWNRILTRTLSEYDLARSGISLDLTYRVFHWTCNPGELCAPTRLRASYDDFTNIGGLRGVWRTPVVRGCIVSETGLDFLCLLFTMVGVRLCAKRRALVIEHYFRTSSYQIVWDRYVNAYGGDPVPNKSTIKQIVDQFRSHGAPPPPRNRPQCVLTPEKLDEI